MNCECVYVGVDPEENNLKVIYCKRIKSIITRRCIECGRLILPGNTYEHFIGTYNKLVTYNTCSVCLSLRNIFFCDNWIFGEIFDYLDEYILDNNCEISSECLLSLTPQARDVVFNMIEQCWVDLESDELH